MPEFGGLLIVVSVAFAAPFLLGLFPRLTLPAVVLEIVAGIVGSNLAMVPVFLVAGAQVHRPGRSNTWVAH